MCDGNWLNQIRRIRALPDPTELLTIANIHATATIPTMPTPPALGISFPFATDTAATLADIATRSEAQGDGMLHLSPWRSFMVRPL